MQIRLRCELEIPTDRTVLAGYTCNLSRSGALLEVVDLRQSIPLGEKVTLRIELPTSRVFEPKCMECAAVVHRSEAGADETIVLALQIVAVQFRSLRRMRLRQTSKERASAYVC